MRSLDDPATGEIPAAIDRLTRAIFDAVATVMDRFRRMIEQELQLIELRAKRESK